MRRLILVIGLILGVSLSTAHPYGQRGPTLSDDLKRRWRAASAYA